MRVMPEGMSWEDVRVGCNLTVDNNWTMLLMERSRTS